MTLAGVANFERVIDRVAPALLLVLGLVTAASLAAVGA
jgi:hypothetical protein